MFFPDHVLIRVPEDCINDADCSNHGECINIDATSYPKRQCFCEQGWFGQQCNRGKKKIRKYNYQFVISSYGAFEVSSQIFFSSESALKTASFNPTYYQRRTMSTNYVLYYRVLEVDNNTFT